MASAAIKHAETPNSPHAFRIQRNAELFAHCAALVVVAIAILDLAAWAFHLEAWRSPGPGIQTMKVNTALAFIAAGAALWGVVSKRWGPAAISAAAGFVAALPALSLSQDIFGWNLGIDQFLIADPVALKNPTPGRTSPASDICFILLAFALQPAMRASAAWLTELCAIGTLGLCGISLVGYIFRATALYGVFTTRNSLSPYTAVLFLLLSIGVLVCAPPGPLASVVLKDSYVGRGVRRLIPLVVVIPIPLGWLFLQGELRGIFSAESGLGMMVAFAVLFLSAVVLLNARSLQRFESIQHQTEHEILARDAIRRADEQYRQLLMTAPEAMIIVNPEGLIGFANAKAQDIFGYRKDELLGTSVEELVPELARAGHQVDRNAYTRNPSMRIMGHGRQIKASDRHGRVFDAEITLFPIETSDGIVIAASIQDITARRKIEEIQARHAAIIESSHAAIFSKTLDGMITSWNHGAEDLYGYTAEEACGQSIAILVPPDRIDEVPELLLRISAGQQIKVFETVRMRKNGSEVHVALSLSPIRDSAGRIVGSSAIGRDITETIAARDVIQASLREKETLLREIHHRVKNNMQLVSSLLSMQADSVANDQLRQLLEDGQSRVRAISMLHEILYSSRNLACVDFNAYVHSLWGSLARAHSDFQRVRFETSINVEELDIDSALPCALIVTELASNSLKHAFPDKRAGVITVALQSQPDGHLWLRVSDDGIGLTSANRADGSRRGSIGLSLIDALVGQLRATAVWSTPGTVFTAEFPVHHLS